MIVGNIIPHNQRLRGNATAIVIDGQDVSFAEYAERCYRLAHALIERGVGHVVNIGSVAGLYPMSSGVYGASKGAIHFLSTNLRLELAGTGIRVTEICPGRVRTEFYDAAIDDPDLRDAIKETGVTEITSEDVAAAIAYALDAPWYVNVARIELQPTEQTYGGMQVTPIQGRDQDQ